MTFLVNFGIYLHSLFLHIAQSAFTRNFDTFEKHSPANRFQIELEFVKITYTKHSKKGMQDENKNGDPIVLL